jgi:hypothetical protein
MSLIPSTAYEALVGIKSNESPLERVKPGAPEQSYLVKKLNGQQVEAGGSGAQMPFGTEPLDPELRARIVRWIEEGALNN